MTSIVKCVVPKLSILVPIIQIVQKNTSRPIHGILLTSYKFNIQLKQKLLHRSTPIKWYSSAIISRDTNFPKYIPHTYYYWNTFLQIQPP